MPLTDSAASRGLWGRAGTPGVEWRWSVPGRVSAPEGRGRRAVSLGCGSGERAAGKGRAVRDERNDPCGRGPDLASLPAEQDARLSRGMEAAASSRGFGGLPPRPGVWGAFPPRFAADNMVPLRSVTCHFFTSNMASQRNHNVIGGEAVDLLPLSSGARRQVVPTKRRCFDLRRTARADGKGSTKGDSPDNGRASRLRRPKRQRRAIAASETASVGREERSVTGEGACGCRGYGCRREGE